jgi:hypothetical protein
MRRTPVPNEYFIKRYTAITCNISILNFNPFPSHFVPLEGRGQKTEDRCQKTEDGGRKTAGRRQKSEIRGQRTEDRGQRSEVGDQWSEVRHQQLSTNSPATEPGLRGVQIQARFIKNTFVIKKEIVRSRGLLVEVKPKGTHEPCC